MNEPAFHQGAGLRYSSKCSQLAVMLPDLVIPMCLFAQCIGPIYFAKQNIFEGPHYVTQQLLQPQPGAVSITLLTGEPRPKNPVPSWPSVLPSAGAGPSAWTKAGPSAGTQVGCLGSYLQGHHASLNPGLEVSKRAAYFVLF